MNKLVQAEGAAQGEEYNAVLNEVAYLGISKISFFLNKTISPSASRSMFVLF